MALADKVNQPTPVMHGKPCSVGVLLETLEGDELEALKTMLGTPEKHGWTASQIYDALVSEGYEVAYQTIGRHRGGRCRCVKAAA